MALNGRSVRKGVDCRKVGRAGAEKTPTPVRLDARQTRIGTEGLREGGGSEWESDCFRPENAELFGSVGQD